MQTENLSNEESARAIIREITYYEKKLRKIGEPKTDAQAGMVRVYEQLVSYRRQLLKAMQDGNPDLWHEYTVGDAVLA